MPSVPVRSPNCRFSAVLAGLFLPITSPVLPSAQPPSLPGSCRVSAPAEPDLGSSSAARSGTVAAASQRAPRRESRAPGGEQASGHSAKPHAARASGPAGEGAGSHAVWTLPPPPAAVALGKHSCGIREVTGLPGGGGSPVGTVAAVHHAARTVRFLG